MNQAKPACADEGLPDLVGAAHTLACWNWDRAAGRLRIATQSRHESSALDGDWTLEAFLEQIEGLTRGQLREALSLDGFRDGVDIRIHLHSGQAVRLVGSFFDDGQACGLLLDEQGQIPVLAQAQTDALTNVYQPIHCLKTGKLAGFEALARWQGADGNLIRPDQLHPHTSIIDFSAIAPIVLEQAIAVWQDLPQYEPALFMQMNLSATELARPELVKRLIEIVRPHALPPQALRIELTEHTALRDRDLAHDALSELQAAGFGLVLDDFGAGHSSLIWLAEIPAIGLKIDPNLAATFTSPKGAHILRVLIDMAHGLDMCVTAEGMENHSQAQFFADMGCDHGQGYVFGRPTGKESLKQFF